MTEPLTILAGALLLGGLIAELVAVVAAPVGYQDEGGFHVGERVSKSTADEPWENPS